ncbi:MAG TPA: L-threonylcarbamoyladenylate synthase [Anaerovoracaceae bacterium]|nr:L-threonylcarbamoyladenylate synthase [Anaerovoracaceae bacterium]
MQTKIFKNTTEDMREAAKIIADGGLVAFPTETVYGLGADALNAEAVGKVYAAKGRPSDNPMIVHISAKSDLDKLAAEVTPDMRTLMDKFWPGPMTMVVKKKDIVPYVTTGGLDTVAIRMPDNFTAQKLIAESGCPIAAPSANLSGKPSPTTAQHVIDDMMGRIDGIIAGLDCRVGIESTVIDMTGDVPTILRPGILTKEDFAEALCRDVKLDPTLLTRPSPMDTKGEGLLQSYGTDFKPKAPGMKYKHYAPKAEMIIFQGEDDQKVKVEIEKTKEARESQGQKVKVIVYDSAKPETAAHNFFGELRAADKEAIDVILASALAESGVGFAVMNRMFKSAGYNIVQVK